VRLRKEGRLSYSEISQQTGASKGSLSYWLRQYPLSEAEVAKKRARRQPRRRSRSNEEPSRLYTLFGSTQLTRLQKGKVAEAAVLLRFCLLGFNPFGSVFDGDKIDWVVESGKDLFKIQVKWVERYSGVSPRVSLLHSWKHKVYSQGDFDFLVGFDFFTDTCYVWAWSEVENVKSAITVDPSAVERWDKVMAQET